MSNAKQKIAVIPSTGIGDALIFLIISHHLRMLGNDVVTFSPHLQGLGAWLPEERSVSPLTDWELTLQQFDVVILQHDNSTRAKDIASLRKKGCDIFILYPSYRYSKHPPLLSHRDFAFDETKNMVDNVRNAFYALFKKQISPFNGIIPPAQYTHRLHCERVIIHPTSTSTNRNWPKDKFLKLSDILIQKKFKPIFLVPSHEQLYWQEVSCPLLPTLADVCALIYESGYFIGNNSGPGHLASYLRIPTLIIGHHEQHMRLWKPGWLHGQVICPPKWVPNFKPLRLREHRWKMFITTKSVINKFFKKLLCN